MAVSKFAERFGQRVRLQNVGRVPSGSPIRLSLRFLSGADIPEAARILARRHLSLRAAHAALTAMLDHGEAFVTVPCVEDLQALKNDLLAIGVIAKA